jgi:hypothetical protein
VQLTDSTSSTSTTTAATPNSVKTSYDLANTANTTANTANSTANAAIPKSTVTGKGSLVAATAASTPANLSVGNNGEQLIADSSATSGLRWQASQAAGRNYLINGNFDVAQRGSSFASSGYFFDRWTDSGSINAVTATLGTSGAPSGSTNYLVLTSTAGSSYKDVRQYIESLNVEMLRGKTVTISVLLRRNATVNNSGFNLKIDKSATVDASSAATWTNVGSVTVPLASIPTGTTSSDWYQATLTVTIPNDGTANSLLVYLQYNGATANASVLNVSQFQLEIGSVATSFSRAGGTIQGELAACQRYYYQIGGEYTYQEFAIAQCSSSTVAEGVVTFPVQMRTQPSVTFTSTASQFAARNSSGAEQAGTATTATRPTTVGFLFRVTVASGLTAGNASTLCANNSTSPRIYVSAEL